MTWAADYLGHTWRAGANGPDSWDCWSFFRHVQATHYGRKVSDVCVDASNIHAVARAFGNHDERENWNEVEAPLDGDAVLMSHSRYPSHVGIYLAVDGGGVLHCQNGAGVIFTHMAALPAMGWGRINFFRAVA